MMEPKDMNCNFMMENRNIAVLDFLGKTWNEIDYD